MIRRCIISLFFLVIMGSVIHSALAIAGDTKDMVSRITVQELKSKIDHDDLLIIDVRSGDDYARSKIKIKGAVRINVVHLAEKSDTLPKDKEIVTYCTWHDEATSARAAQILMDKGFKKVAALKGGFHAWTDAGYPTEPK